MAKRRTEPHRAAWNLSHEMADLLGWARHPSPEPLSPGWADAYKKNTVSVVEYALQVFESDKTACRKLKSVRKLAFEFIALLANNPTLAVVPVHEWPVAAYRQLFDDLAALEREFRILSNTDEQPAGNPATTEPAAAIVVSHPLSPSKEKWPTEDYAKNAIIRLRETPELQKNISKFCRSIADEQGIPEIASSLKKLLYEPEYKTLWKP